MGRSLSRLAGAALVWAATGAALAPVAGAVTYSRPGAYTGAAREVTATSALITGTVSPNKVPTSFYVEYGPSSHYGLRSQLVGEAAFSGHPAISVPITGLLPNTGYHYRVVATNVIGTTAGRDRTLVTAKIPLSLGIIASPNPVTLGGATTVAGDLAGTGNAGRVVFLQASAFPFTAGFTNVGNPEVTLADGGFSFAVPALVTLTKFRVVSATKPLLVSSEVTVSVKVRVSAKISLRRRHGRLRARFAGRIFPAEDAAPVFIERFNGHGWSTVARTSATHNNPLSSRFARTIRLRRGGLFRVAVRVNDGGHSSNASDPMLVRLRRR